METGKSLLAYRWDCVHLYFSYSSMNHAKPTVRLKLWTKLANIPWVTIGLLPPAQVFFSVSRCQPIERRHSHKVFRSVIFSINCHGIQPWNFHTSLISVKFENYKFLPKKLRKILKIKSWTKYVIHYFTSRASQLVKEWNKLNNIID